MIGDGLTCATRFERSSGCRVVVTTCGKPARKRDLGYREGVVVACDDCVQRLREKGESK